MPTVFRKSRGEILNQALAKLANNTTISSTAPGSIARAITEAITAELSDMYDIMDYNFRQQIVTTATGSSLDMIGALHNVERKRLSTVATIDKMLGSFYFYLESPFNQQIVIPSGTNVFTDPTSYLGRQFSYSTTEDAIIPVGRLRAPATIKANFIEATYTAGANTITFHDFAAPVGATVKCTNPKIIAAQIGYEEDESFRARIIKKIRVNAAGTGDALRFAALAIPGVRDVKIRQAPYGFGSCEMIVVPEDMGTADSLVQQVNSSIDESVRAMGVRLYIKAPRSSTVSVDMQLVAPVNANALVLAGMVQKAQSAAARFIARLLPGESLLYNKFVQSILDSSEYINDVIITRYSIAGIESPRRNYQPEPDVLLVPGGINVSVAKP